MNSQSVLSKPPSVAPRAAAPLVLAIEPNDDDYQMLQYSFGQLPRAPRLVRCQTGDRALEYLTRSVRSMPVYPSPIPTLILLDLNLPDIEGRQVLAKIKQDPVLHYIPTVILTASNRPEDIRECYGLGVGGYILKNVDPQHLQESIGVVSDFWLNAVKLPEISDRTRS